MNKRSKAFLALKVVSSTMKSLWVQSPPLVQNYEIGATITCRHPKFPFFIAGADDIYERTRILTGARMQGERNLIILVYSKYLSEYYPWCNDVCQSNLDMTLDKLAERTITRWSSHIASASKLKVLSEIPANANVLDELKKMARKMHLPILGHSS